MSKLKLFFQKVFSLFKEEKPKEESKQTILLAKADLWLDHKARHLCTENKFTEIVYHFKGHLDDKKFFLESLINDWETKLTEQQEEPKTSFSREEQLGLISQIRQFLEKLELEESPKLSDLRKLSYLVETTLKEKVRLLEDWKTQVEDNLYSGDKDLVKKLNTLHNEMFEIELLLNDFALKMKSSKVENVLELQKTLFELKQVIKREEEFQEKATAQKERLDLVRSQREEKEIDLIKLKDSSDHKQHSQSSLLDEESIMNKLEKLEDEIFFCLVKMKKSLSELEDFNSDYSLLDQVQEINSYQENFAYIFDPEKYKSLLSQLSQVEESLVSGELSEKEGLEFNFSDLLQEFRIGKLRNILEEHNILRERLKILPTERLKDDYYSRIEDIDYRLKHFQKQEAEVVKELERLHKSLEKCSLLKSRKKGLFENMVKLSFDTEFELVLMEDEPKQVEQS